ncbi:MAG: sugar phosphate isomerase/epimerase [Gelidibacter sp.]
MAIKYLYPFWGSEHIPIEKFIADALENGFDGIEIHIPNDKAFEDELYVALQNIRRQHPDFILVVQQVFGVKHETPTNYLWNVLKRMGELRRFKPDFINSHTGKDHYSFEDNCYIIDAIEDFSRTSNIPIYHEIHRGRFTFHSATTLKYLEMFPEIKLVGDLSHWCVVSESMLEDQESIIKQIIPYIHHIHARVGTPQTAQVNHPFAPEWQSELNCFVTWWQRIIDYHSNEAMSITPEFGPYPYMPQTPFEQRPLANQQELNLQMKTFLQTHLKSKPCNEFST